MIDILTKIIAKKHLNIHQRKHAAPLNLLQQKISSKEFPVRRSFLNALQAHIDQYGQAIITELKKASPSKGLLCANYQPSQLAQEYEKNGAACLSVLTEQDFFLGHDDDLRAARENTSLPILRKDFIIDPYQIYESKLIGADCILLIAAALSKQELLEFYQLANSLDLAVLIEVANERELEWALQTQTTFIGVNNRNLRDFTINLENTIRLKKLMPSDKIVICESGIKERGDIEKMLSHHISVFLIGETLVKASHPGTKLRELVGNN